VVFENIRGDSKTQNYNAVLSKKEVAKPFEDMLPILVARKIIIANVKVQKFKRL